MRLEELTQPGWGEAANYFGVRDRKYVTAKLKVPAVVMPQTDMPAATPSPTTFEELMQTLDIDCKQPQMPALSSGLESSQIRLWLEKPQ